MLTGMEEKRRRNWPWWLLALAFGFVHFWVCIFVEVNFGPLAGFSYISHFPGDRPPPPTWFYYAFINVFAFPATVIDPLIPRGPKIQPSLEHEVCVFLVIILTCFLWGMVWAEPFRWKFGWRPWRFTIRELLGATAAVACVLGWLAWLSRRG